MFNIKVNKIILIKDSYASIIYNLLINNIIFQRLSLEIPQSYTTGRLPKYNMTKLNNNKYGLLNHLRIYHTDKINNSYFNIKEWLVGLTDSKGIFNIYINNNKIIFIYKITLNTSSGGGGHPQNMGVPNNKQLLYKIKEYLGTGTIKINNNIEIYYIINNKEDLINIIVPIFDKYPLLTSKRYNYLKFKECLMINNNILINNNDKINIINNIINQRINNNYISDIWYNINNNILLKLITDINIFQNMEDKRIFRDKINNIITKSWIIGFIENEGKFLIIKDSSSNNNHIFKVNLKLEPIIYNSLIYLWDIELSRQEIKLNNNKVTSSSGAGGIGYFLELTNLRDIKLIIKYFRYSNYKSVFLGIKSLEYRIWTRKYIKNIYIPDNFK